MKLGEIARIARGVTTGNREIFIMSRTRARDLGIEAFVKSVLTGVRSIAKDGPQMARDNDRREVVLLASRRDVESHERLRAYLGEHRPRLANVRIAPIAATYTGIPRFISNPDGLVVTNALYTVTPRQDLTDNEVLMLVERLNRAMAGRKDGDFGRRMTPRQFDAIDID